MLFYSITRIADFFRQPFIQIAYICLVKICLQIAFIIIILGGSLGIPVYQHTCSSENKSEQTLFVDASSCNKHEEVHKEKSCCADKESPEKAANNCCTVEVSAYKVSFFKQFQSEFQFSLLDLPKVNTTDVFSFPVITVTENEVLAFADLPPPKLLKRLALIQVWRI